MNAEISHMDRRRAVLTGALAPSRRLRVVDVGANPLSAPPYQGLLEDRACEVFGFEPNPEAFEKLQATKSDLETYLPNAVGLPGARVLHLHPKSGFSSLFPMDRASLKVIGKEHLVSQKTSQITLTPVTLDTLAELPQIDLLKMDLQGGELEVLRGGLSKLAQAVAIVTEVRFYRIYEGEPMFGDLDVELRRQGFRLHKFMFTKSVMMPHDHEIDIQRKRMTSQLLDGDAVYLREADYTSDFNDDQLMHLALVADMVDSPDLALMCLDALASRGRIGPQVAIDYIAHLRVNQRAEKPQ